MIGSSGAIGGAARRLVRLSRIEGGAQPTSSPAEAADRLLAVIDGLEAGDTGGFFAQTGAPIPW